MEIFEPVALCLYWVPKMILTLQLVPASLLISDALGLLDLHDQLLDRGVDRFGRASRNFNDLSAFYAPRMGIPDPLPKLEPLPFKLFGGLCKLVGVLAQWTNKGLEQLATACFCILFATVAVEHWLFGDPELLPPIVMFAVAATKLMSRPTTSGSGGKRMKQN